MSKRLKPIVYIFLIYLAAQFLPVLIGVIAPTFMESSGIVNLTIYSNIATFIIGAIAMIYVANRFHMTNKVETGKKSSALNIILYGVLGVFLSIIGQYLATIIEVNFLGESLSSANTQSLLEIANAYPLFILAITLFGPIMEEFVFRKAMFGPLYRHVGGVGAAVISSLIFALIHFDGHILLYSVIGFVFCYVYYKTGSIVTPILSHVLMNAIAILPLYIN